MATKQPAMGKGDLVEAVSKATSLPKADAAKALEAILETIRGALKKGTKVTLVGFGTFEVRKRKKRMGVNPRTGEKISIAATKVPAFRAGQGLKDLVSGKKK